MWRKLRKWARTKTSDSFNEATHKDATSRCSKRRGFQSIVSSSFLDVFELFLLHSLDFCCVFDGNHDFSFLFVLSFLLSLFLLPLLQNRHLFLFLFLQVFLVLLGDFLL